MQFALRVSTHPVLAQRSSYQAKMIMKVNLLLLVIPAVSLVWSSATAFNVSLELQGGDCSDQLTLICRHSDVVTAPLWTHNRRAESDGVVLGTAFPGAIYTVRTATEHRATFTGVENITVLDIHVIQCVYNVLGNVVKSNAVKYSFIPPDFQPKLVMRSVVPSFIGSFCTLTYELEDDTEGMARYPSCTNKIRVNFTVSPNASITNTMNSNNIAEYNITNLTRCTEYDTFATYYLGGQEMGRVYAADSVMTSPGAFNVSNVAFVSSTMVHITIEEVSPDCPSFPTKWYNITIRRGDGTSNQKKRVEANKFPPLNDSVTVSVTFDTPLPQGMLDVEVLKVNAVPVKLNETGSPVDTETFQNWNSSSKATVFNPHPPPPTMATTTVPLNAADVAVVAGVSAAVLVACVVVCCGALCMCMMCCRKRKSTQGNYTIGRPPRTVRLNSYETVHHEVALGMGEEERVVGAEVGTSNIQDAFPVREMVSSDEPQGITDLVVEDDEVLPWGVMGYGVVLPSEVPNQNPEDPLEDGLEEETGRSASALQRGELKQFHKTDKACFNGEEEHTKNEIGDVHSRNEPLGEVEQNMPDMVMKVVGRSEKVIESEKRPDPTLQEDVLSVSSSTSLQDPRDVIAEMSVKSVVVDQVHSSDKDRDNELDVQDGGKASAPSNSPPKSGDNATAATKEGAVEFHENSSETGTDSLPPPSVAVAELKRGTLSEIPLGKAQVDNDKECAGTITKPSGDVRVGLQLSHYADIDFSKKGPIPAPRNEMYNVVYAEIKK